MTGPRPVPAVIATVWRGGRVLLVRRHNPPNAHRWGFPGGKLEPGERVLAAAERELAEETGLAGTAVRAFDAVDVIDPDGDPPSYHYVLVAVLVDAPTGEPVAADDVDEAAWCDPAALPTPQVPDLDRIVASARALVAGGA